MAIREILIIVALGTLVFGFENDDIEHKKRGAGKTSGVNTIPTGVQKSEYTYDIYPQSPNTQSGSTSTNYQVQFPNSFYPNQANSQYYNPSSGTKDGAISHSNPPSNVASPQSTSQYVPLNFVPNPGYQAKYHILSSKPSNGHIQLSVLQPSAGLSTSNYHLPQTVYSSATNQINSHTNPLLTSVTPHGYFNFPTNYQPLSIGSPYLGHAPTVLFPQLNHPFYSNLLYSTPGQNFYFTTNSQPKPNYSQSSQASSSNAYDKLQGSPSQSTSKEENDIAAQSSELIHTDSISGYKGYTTGRSSAYTKLT